MICIHFKPQQAEIRASRKELVNDYVYSESSIRSFITFFKQLSIFDSRMPQELTKALEQFENAHENQN